MTEGTGALVVRDGLEGGHGGEARQIGRRRLGQDGLLGGWADLLRLAGGVDVLGTGVRWGLLAGLFAIQLVEDVLRLTGPPRLVRNVVLALLLGAQIVKQRLGLVVGPLPSRRHQLDQLGEANLSVGLAMGAGLAILMEGIVAEDRLDLVAVLGGGLAGESVDRDGIAEQLVLGGGGVLRLVHEDDGPLVTEEEVVRAQGTLGLVVLGGCCLGGGGLLGIVGGKLLGLLLLGGGCRLCNFHASLLGGGGTPGDGDGLVRLVEEGEPRGAALGLLDDGADILDRYAALLLRSGSGRDGRWRGCHHWCGCHLRLGNDGRLLLLGLHLLHLSLHLLHDDGLRLSLRHRHIGKAHHGTSIGRHLHGAGGLEDALGAGEDVFVVGEAHGGRAIVGSMLRNHFDVAVLERGW